MSWGIHNAPSHKFLLLFRVSPRHPLSNHWNLIIPDNRFPKRSNHDRFGASSISLTRSWKYVGWLLGSSKRPLSLNCHPHISIPIIPKKHIRWVHTRSLYRSCSRNCNALAFNISSGSIDGL